MAKTNRITVAAPVVELDGDEMARIVWRAVKETLILPYLDVELEYFDLGIENRDATGDRVTVDAAHAVGRRGAGVKCPTITPDEARVEEFGLKAMYRSPNLTIRGILGGVLFREPVVVPGLPRPVPGWTEPVVIARHACGDRATELRVPGEGTLTLAFTPKDGAEPVELEVYDFPGPGVALATYDLDASVRDFARTAFRYGLERGCPVHLSTKNVSLKKYDGRCKALFQEVYDAEFQADFERAGLVYEHCGADAMAREVFKRPGGFVWACRSHDADVFSGIVAQGFGSPGLMTSVLLTADGRTLLAEAGHGTVTRHYRQYQQGGAAATDPVGSLFAWTRALAHRGALDGTPEVTAFARTLEQTCVETVEGGQMTRDLAQLTGPDRSWLTTEQFLAAVDENLGRKRAASV
ncbi:NADP-dependent isocitrate dehydrogenase [Streptomyces gamaensis]|uniref:Isocitrate dehydrogenase [NADP] n=1 Tax=Streptomyces gamaensis TaxID=1763542 RepID=A0ABW0ZBC7_9ACTN